MKAFSCQASGNNLISNSDTNKQKIYNSVRAYLHTESFELLKPFLNATHHVGHFNIFYSLPRL
jgi:hypothetical protein